MYQNGQKVIKRIWMTFVSHMRYASIIFTLFVYNRSFLQHLSSTEPDKIAAADLKIPIRFCVEGQTRIRYLTDSVNDDASTWDELEETWRTFWKSRGGKEGLVDRKKACTGGERCQSP